MPSARRASRTVTVRRFPDPVRRRVSLFEACRPGSGTSLRCVSIPLLWQSAFRFHFMFFFPSPSPLLGIRHVFGTAPIRKIINGAARHRLRWRATPHQVSFHSLRYVAEAVPVHHILRGPTTEITYHPLMLSNRSDGMPWRTCKGLQTGCSARLANPAMAWLTTFRLTLENVRLVPPLFAWSSDETSLFLRTEMVRLTSHGRGSTAQYSPDRKPLPRRKQTDTNHHTS